MRRSFVVTVTFFLLLFMGLLPAAAQQGFNYVVRGGDTLAGIAAQFNVPLNTLAAANGISNQNVVFSGQILFIPAPAPAPAQPQQPQFGTGGPTVDVIIAPNTPGIVQAAPVTAQPATPTAAQSPSSTQPTTYTVRTGDTLFGIATSFGVTSESIAELNDITNLNDVRVGQVLELPSNAQQQFGTGGPTTTTPVATRPFNYVVQRGEYLELLALRFGTTVEAITEANDLSNPSVIFPGEILVIP